MPVAKVGTGKYLASTANAPLNPYPPK